jgi:heme oxygenase
LNAATSSRLPVIDCLRSATDALHQRIETSLDIVADSAVRRRLIEQYAGLHIPADASLGPYLADVHGLDFRGRSRARFLLKFAGTTTPPAFPIPANRAEALGMLYVLEGSTLGGRLILRMLAARGIEDPDLAFLDPYGAETGRRWRSFLSVLSREIDDEEQIGAACRGARSGFQHAERLLA